MISPLISLVDVSGDRNDPKLEPHEHAGFRWIGSTDLTVLDENKGQDHGMTRMLVELALRSSTGGQPAFPHVTIFVPLDSVERERARWDPAMASQIGAHVTVVYPSEVMTIEDLRRRLAEAAVETPSFRLGLGTVGHFGGPENGVFASVKDVDGGWAACQVNRLPFGWRKGDLP